MKTLIVYYTRSGNTRKVAEELKELLSADIEEITEPSGRGGPLGWLRSGKESSDGTIPKINAPTKDPSAYDIVVVGTPVWASTLSSPVRAYLTQTKGKAHKVAYFCTCGGTDAKKTIIDMSVLIPAPVASLEVNAKEMSTSEYKEKAKKFADQLK
jgi:flavodoxin